MASESVLAAVEAELGGRPEDWRSTLARTLAVGLDKEPNASMARELRALMNEIAANAAPEVSSVADDLVARRAARIASAAS